jgi:hypothetical protein
VAADCGDKTRREEMRDEEMMRKQQIRTCCWDGLSLTVKVETITMRREEMR